MADAFILSAVRTPIGKYLGGLSELPAPQLGALVVGEARCVDALGLRGRPAADLAARAEQLNSTIGLSPRLPEGLDIVLWTD